MIKSKVLDILNSFSTEEVKRFEEYLSSPFHNKNVRIIRLFKLIKKFHPDFDNPRLSKENLKKKLLGSEKSKDSYLRNLFSDLNEKAEDFLSYINYKNDNSFTIHLIRELYSRNNIKSVDEKLRMFEMLIEKDKFKSPTYYHDKEFVTEMKTNFKVNRKLVENSRKHDIENKFYFFMISIMESYSQTFIEQQRANINHDYSILNHLLDYLKKDITKFKKAPLLQIYYYACLCFLNDCSENYFKLFINIYDFNKKYLSPIDKRNINSLILTYYSKKNKTDSGNYCREALMLYIEMIDNNYLSHTKSGYIDLIAIRNIVVLCMQVKDKNIFVSFMKSFNDIVAPDSREEIKLYANSLYSVMIKDFKKALMFLGKINFNSFLEALDDNLYFKADIKKYTIICFIELGYHENALVQIDSFKHYLNYSRIIPKDMKLMNYNFLNLLKEVIFLKMEFDDYRLHKFEKKIIETNEKNIYLKEWLLEKSKEIKKSGLQ